MSAKLTTDELLERLRYWSLKKEEQGFYAVMLEEVAVENGARRLDALVMNCVPSRGLTLVGYEVKATRQDWLRELKRPEKADLAAEYLDAFYLVTVPGVVKAGELPDRWGLMLPHGRKNLKVEAEAKPQEGKDTPRQLLAGMLRKAIRQELEREVETRAAAAEEEARRWYERRANHDRECAERATEEAKRMRQEWDEFHKLAGIEFGVWYRSGDAANVARIYNEIKGRNDGAVAFLRGLQRQARQAHEAAARLDSLIEDIEAELPDPDRKEPASHE